MNLPYWNFLFKDIFKLGHIRAQIEITSKDSSTEEIIKRPL